jgi:hypothetical protein
MRGVKELNIDILFYSIFSVACQRQYKMEKI